MWMDGLSVVAENPNTRCREGVGTLSCVSVLLGYCSFYHWIIVVLDLGSAQPHLLAVSGGGTFQSQINLFATSSDAVYGSACQEVQPALV